MADGGWGMADGRRGGAAGAGGRDTAWLLAALPSANLLPAAKFVGNGLLINQLRQVDLRLAPLDTRQPVTLPPAPAAPPRLPGVGMRDIRLRG